MMTHREKLVMRLLDAARRLQGIYNWRIGLPKSDWSYGAGNELADVLDEIRALPAESESLPPEAERASGWIPLGTGRDPKDGTTVIYWNTRMGQPYVGDNWNYEDYHAYASHWLPFTSPLPQSSEGKS